MGRGFEKGGLLNQAMARFQDRLLGRGDIFRNLERVVTGYIGSLPLDVRLEFLSNGDPIERWVVAEFLSHPPREGYHDFATVQALVGALRSEVYPGTKGFIMAALGHSGSPLAKAALEELLLNGTELTVRIRAARFLEGRSSLLSQFLDHSDRGLRVVALRDAAAQGNPNALSRLIGEYETFPADSGEDRGERSELVSAIARSGQAAAIPFLRQVVATSVDIDERRAALEGLHDANDSSEGEFLVQEYDRCQERISAGISRRDYGLLRDTQYDLINWMAERLSPSTAPFIACTLSHTEDRDLVEAAIEGFVKRRNLSAIPILESLVGDYQPGPDSDHGSIPHQAWRALQELRETSSEQE
jgi:hypothetical protein